MHFLQSRVTSRKLFNVLSSRQGQHKFLAIYKSQEEEEKQNKAYLYQIPPWMKKNKEKVEKSHPENSEVQKERKTFNDVGIVSNLEKADTQQTFNEINVQEMTRCKSVYKIKRRLSPIPKKPEEKPKIEKAKELIEGKAKHDFFSRPPPVESPFKVLQSKSLKFPPRIDPFPVSTELFNFKEPITMTKKFEIKNLSRKTDSQVKSFKVDEIVQKIDAHKIALNIAEKEKQIKEPKKLESQVKSFKVNEIVQKIDAQKIAFNIAEKEKQIKEPKKLEFKKFATVQEIEKNVEEILKKKTALKSIEKEKTQNKIPEKTTKKNKSIINEIDKNVKEILKKKAAIPEKSKETSKYSSNKKLKEETLDEKGKQFDFLFPKSVEDKRKVWKEILEKFEPDQHEKPSKNKMVVELANKPLKLSSKEMLFPKETKTKKEAIEKPKRIEKTKSDIDTKNMEVLSPKVDKTKNSKRQETFNESIINLRKEGERLRMEFEKNKKKQKKPKRLMAVLNKETEKTNQPKILSTKKPLRKKRKLRKSVKRMKTNYLQAKPAKISLVPKTNKPQVKDKVLSNWMSQIPDRLILPKYSSRTVFDNSFTKPDEKSETQEVEKQEVIKINDEKQEVKINELKDLNEGTESIYCVALKPDKAKEELNDAILNISERKVEFERLPKQIKDALIRIHSDDKHKNLEFDIMRKTFNYETELKEKDKTEKALVNVDKPKIKIERTGFNFQKKLQNMILKYKCCFQTAIRTWDMNKKIKNEKQKSSILIFGGGKVLNKIKNQKRSKNKNERKYNSGYNIKMRNSSLLQNLQKREKKIVLVEAPKPKKNIVLRNSKHKKTKKANNMTKVKRKQEVKKIEVKPSEPVKIDAVSPGLSYSEILTAVFSNKSISAHFKK